MGKNAKKREARRAFHTAHDASAGKIPYAFHAVIREKAVCGRIVTLGPPRRIGFYSLTSFKEWRETFYPTSESVQIDLVSDLDSLDDSKGKGNRTRVINKGIGQNWDRVKRKLAAPTKSRFLKDGFATDETDAVKNGPILEYKRKQAITSGEVKDRSNESALWAIRQKHRTV